MSTTRSPLYPRHLMLAAGMLLGVVACSEAPGTADGATADAATDVDPFGGFCPREAPQAGAPCTLSSEQFPRVCEYGSDANFACTTRAICRASGWEVVSPDPNACPTNSPYCPAAMANGGFPALGGGSCTNIHALCLYSNGSCNCVRDEGFTSWSCGDYPNVEGCGRERPRAGTVCTGEAYCGYSDLCNMICRNGNWYADSQCLQRYGITP